MRKGQSGMTLIELMLSLSLISLMMFLAWSTTRGTARIKTGLEETQLRNHEIRVAMARMVADISAAYLSTNEDRNDPDRRTLFVGRESSSIDELRFSSLAHIPLWADANESEQTLIAYFDEPDPEDSGKTNLLRWESRRLSNEPWKREPADVDVLLHNVERVKFEYWDWRENEWKERWDSTSADAERDRLPTRVRVTVEIEAPSGKTLKYVTQARLMMQETISVVK